MTTLFKVPERPISLYCVPKKSEADAETGGARMRRKDDIRIEIKQLEWSLDFYARNKLKTEELDCRKRIKKLKRMLGEE